jgi:hypothetical protein
MWVADGRTVNSAVTGPTQFFEHHFQLLSMSTFALNCLLLNDAPTKVFTVPNISKTDNISILKKKIKEEKAPHLNHLAASDLILWKVRLST